MNMDNRRLKEIQAEKLVWQDQLNKTDSVSEIATFQGKIECLEREEQQILKRCDVII
jgi:hypothetical protein